MRNKFIISTALVAAIVIVVNLISQDLFVRLDFSENKQYTLNKATINLLRDLTEPVTVTAYFSESLPPNVAKSKKDFKELLVEYHNRSKGMLVYKFVNPASSDEIEQEAMRSGVQPIMIDVREKDQMKQQKAYMGAVITMGDRKEILPFIQPGAALEYTLSKAIKKISISDKPSLGLLQGHGEPSIQEIVQAYNELNVMYRVEPLTIGNENPIPDRIKTVAIIRPTDSIPLDVFSQLDSFLALGGKIFIAAGLTDANLQNAYGGKRLTGLEKWLLAKGIHITENIVIDISCTQVQVVQQNQGYQMISNVVFPYIPVIKNFADHPAGGGLEALVLPFTNTIEFMGNQNLSFTPLAFSSEKSNTEPLPVYFDIQRQWNNSHFTKSKLTVAAAVEGNFGSAVPSKMVVIASSDFIINGKQGQQQQLSPDNISFMANSIDWLSDDTGLIGLRTKLVTSRPIDDLSDATRTSLKWFNFIFPLLLVLGYGLFRVHNNRMIRLKRMEENYE